MKSLFQNRLKPYFTAFRITLSSLAFIIIVSGQKLSAQAVYDELNWACFFKDATGWPSFDWTQKELVDGIAIGGVQHSAALGILPKPYSIYVAGEVTGATGTTTICGGNSFTYGEGDAMLACYSGGNLNWSTYLGNTPSIEYSHCIAVDKIRIAPGPYWHDYVYVAGEVKNNGALSIPNSFVCSNSGCSVFTTTDIDTGSTGSVAFIAKYDGWNGQLMSWRYFGGNALSPSIGREDQILGIAINPTNHHVVVSGYTTTDGLASNATYPGWDTQLDSGNSGETDGGDGFIAEFDNCLENLIFFTYIGGTGQDRCHDVRFDNDNNLLVTGTVASTGLSYAKTGYSIYQPNKKYGLDVILAKLGPLPLGGYERLFVTYLGGNQNDRGRRIAVDKYANIFITGYTYSPNFPILNPHQATKGGGDYDAFVSKFDGLGNLKWSTYLGGTNDDKGNDILISPKDKAIYVAGQTNSTNLWQNISPTYNSSIQNTLNGDGSTTDVDGFIVALNDVTGPNQGTVVFGTFLGGEGNEDDDQTKSYSPSIILGGNKELLFAENTKSSDIATVTNPATVYGSYSGSYDTYLGSFIFHPNPFGWKAEDTNTPNQNNNLILHPNPASSSVILNFRSTSSGTASVFLINMYGQKIAFPAKNLTEGNNDLELDLSNIANGIYAVEIVTPDQIQKGFLLKE